MRTLTTKQATNDSTKQNKSGEKGRLRSSISPLSTRMPLLQRQCACGGGCPRCKQELGIQTKLKISEPGDRYEQEADHIADEVMRMPEPSVQRQVEPEEEEEETVQRKAIASQVSHLNQEQESPEVPPIVHKVLNSPGQSLDPETREFMENRFGHNFSRVRVHTGASAANSARGLGASAYTVGQNVVFGEGQYAPETGQGLRLLAHELAHVVQQGSGNINPMIQRRLIATGAQTDIETFFSLAESASGLELVRDPATNQITAIGSLATPPTSPSFQNILTDIINDPTNDAEVQFGTHQTAPTPGGGPDTGVAIGMFPLPRDLTGSRVQLIDLDDILAIEAGAPGNGIAKLAHELNENYLAHFAIPTPLVDQFPAAHQAAITAESLVANDLVGPGDRVAEVTFQIGTIVFRAVEDFENYYLVRDLTQDPRTRDVTISDVRRVPKVVVSRLTIDQFVVNSDVVPASGAATATLRLVAGNVIANPESTVLIEGFTDDTGSITHNDDLSERRAESTRLALFPLGVDPTRVHIVGRGETGFVALNDTDANRALNRRVVITVTRPSP
jgi:outer membrane protein OmpA-like peptidoglycan-associated protein